MSHRKISLIVGLVALALDVVCGFLFAAAEHIPIWHGIYCALANAATLGGDVSPTNSFGYAVNFIEILTIVPLFGASITFFTSGLSELHIKKHLGKAVEDLKRHVSSTVGAIP